MDPLTELMCSNTLVGLPHLPFTKSAVGRISTGAPCILPKTNKSRMLDQADASIQPVLSAGEQILTTR